MEQQSVNNIYPTTKRVSVKQASRLAWEDDPTFLAFRKEVWDTCERSGEEPIKNWKLYGLWYCPGTFPGYWKQKPSKTVSNNMIVILCGHYFHFAEAEMIMASWLKMHFPYITDKEFEEFYSKTLVPTWERRLPIVEKAREQKNARRREGRRTGMKKGRPKQTGNDCLHDRILEALTQPHTLGGLVTLLDANRKTLYSQLKRMTEAGEVEKQERGLYALPASQDITETCVEPVERGVYEIVDGVENSSTPVETNPKIEPAVERQPEPVTHPISKNEHERIFRRLQQMRPDVDRVKFQELISDPDIGLDGIVGAITQYEQQVAR